MRIATISMVVSAAFLAGCVGDSGTLITAPAYPAVAEGNPPPPKVLGTLSSVFVTNPVEQGAAQQFVFAGQAYYNRNLASGTNLLEMATGNGRIRANASGVIAASGTVTLVNATTGAQLTLNLAQLVGFTGPLFVPCPPGSPTNCFALNASLNGIITPVGGPPIPAVGRFKYRWDSN